MEAIDVIKASGPRALAKGLQKWNYEDELIWHQGKIYVPPDDDLKKNIVRMYHNSIATGHPGRCKTYVLVSNNFWWPEMSMFIKEYVTGCAIYQNTKSIMHPTQTPLMLNKIPKGPWQTVIMDFITDLLHVGLYDSIHMTVDRSTKGVVYTPCAKAIDAEGTADLYMKNI